MEFFGDMESEFYLSWRANFTEGRKQILEAEPAPDHPWPSGPYGAPKFAFLFYVFFQASLLQDHVFLKNAANCS